MECITFLFVMDLAGFVFVFFTCVFGVFDEEHGHLDCKGLPNNIMQKAPSFSENIDQQD